MYFRTGGRDERERYQYNFLTVQRYLSMKCQKKEPKIFFVQNKLVNIAVYGLGELGKCLIEDLAESDVRIAYIVDQGFTAYPGGYRDIPVIGVDHIQMQEDVDAVVVTVLFELNKIVDVLLDKKVELEKIMNLNDVVYSM